VTIIISSGVFLTVKRQHGNKRQSMEISVTPLNYAPSKTHCLVQDSPLYLFYKPSCSQFSVNIPKFSLLWQQG